ncbi:MAG: preprotein translocase subunit YajC [Prevotella sp.]|jgi:preprotein translocase subunit YajC|nr:preprotein translocase subunit YajC [Prevotella sp.]MCH4181904.1 preprotein translocase subunit YajC [Prevotella sp.]MCH4212216.1 preprotein translocase subunit YajC [Prevotella sp.]MCH4241503.1 preprotein translocase subunit YajC [Prevotella sp.]MCI1741628.1 preprotein translocase subunit YajC [Prevotella sp.]
MMTSLVLAQQGAAGGGMGFLIMMIAIFVIMWLFMIRPQQKKQKEIRKFQNALAEGSEVVTGGGIYGKVKHIDATRNTIDLEIAHGVVITVDKNYVFANPASASQNQAK